jgi:hypothetical protein
MIEPIDDRFESEVRGEVAENSNGENDNREAQSGIRQVQQLIKPLKRFIDEVGCRY